MDRHSRCNIAWRDLSLTVHSHIYCNHSYSSPLIKNCASHSNLRIRSVAASQLNTLGCPELIARSRQEYEQISIRLGNDRDYLRSMRHKVWKARAESPLFDCKQYATGLENLFTKMWVRHAHGESPDHIVTK